MTDIDIEVYHVISSQEEFKTLHKYTVNGGNVLKSNDKGRILLPSSIPAINDGRMIKLFWTKANGKTLFFTFNHETNKTEKVEVETSIEKINDETWGSLDDRERIEKLIKIENEAKSKALRESGLFLIVNKMPGQPIYEISPDNDGIRLLNKESKDVVMPLISNENHTLYNQDQPDLSKFYEKIVPISSTPGNSTIFLFGPSGSGKTYHTNKMLAHLIAQRKELSEINLYYGLLKAAKPPTHLKVTTHKITIENKKSGWSIKADDNNNKLMNTVFKGKIQAVLSIVNFNKIDFESTYGIGRADLIVEILKLLGLVKEHNWNSESSRCGVEWVFAKEGERTLKLYDAPGTEDETAILDAIFEKTSFNDQSISAILLSGVESGQISMKKNATASSSKSSKEMSEKRLQDVQPINEKLHTNLKDLIDTSQKISKKYTYIGNDDKFSYFEELIYESRYINAFVSEMARRLRTKVNLEDVEYKRPYRIVKCPGEQHEGQPFVDYKIICTDDRCTEEGLHKSTLYCSDGNDDAIRSFPLADIHKQMAAIEATGAIFQPETDTNDVIKFIVVVGFNTDDPDKKMRWRSATKELVEILIGTPKLQTA